MKITYLAHSTFLLENNSGSRLITDPVDKGSGYDLHQVKADVVTISHHHFDHDAVDQISGDPIVLDKAEKYEVCGFSITGYPAFHDEVKGAKRGSNILFRIESDGKTVVHLGDLGHFPSEEQLNALSGADALLIPVGGIFTIDGAQAYDLASRLSPKVVIPMHFSTPELTFRLNSLNDFLDVSSSLPVRVLSSGETISL